jgi:hypothetical protein
MMALGTRCEQAAQAMWLENKVILGLGRAAQDVSTLLA